MAGSVAVEVHPGEGHQEVRSPRFALRVPPGSVPEWAPSALEMLEAYQDDPATPSFVTGHHIAAGMPIDGARSALQGFLVAGPAEGGRQLVLGVSARETRTADRLTAPVFIQMLTGDNPHLVTDSARGDAHDDVAFEDAVAARIDALEAAPSSESPAPETPAPETPAPETPAPETPAPETPAPEDVVVAPVSLAASVLRAGPVTIIQTSATTREQLLHEGLTLLRAGEVLTLEGTSRRAEVTRGDEASVHHAAPDRCDITLTDDQILHLEDWDEDEELCLLSPTLAVRDVTDPSVTFSIVHLPRGVAMTVGASAVLGCELATQLPPDVAPERAHGLFGAALSGGRPEAGAVISAPEPLSGVARFVLVDEPDDSTDVPVLKLVPKGVTVDEAAGPTLTAGLPPPGADLPEPAPVHYAFAHKVLPALYSMAPKETGSMLHQKTTELLLDTWRRTEELTGAPPEPSEGLALVERDVLGPLAVFVIQMPPPKTLTEAYYVALVYENEQSFRYLTWERTMDRGAKIGEWVFEDGQPKSRLAGATHADASLASFKAAYRSWLGGTAPVDSAMGTSTDEAPPRSSSDGLIVGVIVVLVAVAAGAWWLLS